MWHLLVSEMAAGCGLGTWQRNSQIRHAVSATIDGVYSPAELVMGIFSHNAACMDARPGRGPACVLLHIGQGTHDPARHPVQTNCSGHGYTPPTRVSESDPLPASLPPRSPAPAPTLTPAAASYMVPTRAAFAREEGWVNATLTCGPDAGQQMVCPMDNPSGWVDPDGTAWLNYVIRGDHAKSGRGGYGFGLATAPHW